MTPKTCWVLTDGRAGNVNAALGLAETLCDHVTRIDLANGFPWKHLPPSLWPRGVLGGGDTEKKLTPPWPDMIVSCGRQSVGPAAEIRRRAKGHTVAVHVQAPRMQAEAFDFVVAPAHDEIDGDNVILTQGSVGRVNRSTLDQAAEDYRSRFAALPRPLVAVCVGGSNKVYDMDRALIAKLAADLRTMAESSGCSLLITTSRRTGTENTALLKQALSDIPGEFWDGTGDNPYFGYLGCADAILVTGDSVNMVSEACATGKPVHVIKLPPKRPSKFELFHEELERQGVIRPFRGMLEEWTYSPLDETRRVATIIQDLLNRRPAPE